MNDAWNVIHAERRALLNDLEALEDARWDRESRCSGWKIRDVVGHLIATSKITPPAFATGMIASGFRFHTMNAKRAAAEAVGTPAEILGRFRTCVDNRSKPPGPIEAMVGEIVVHGDDIRGPLGIAHTYDPDALATTADFYRRGNLLIGGKRRSAGLRLVATDQDWSAGEGPDVNGPMRALVSAIAGRRDALVELVGRR